MRKQLTEICDRLEITSNKESSHHNVDQVSIVKCLHLSMLQVYLHSSLLILLITFFLFFFLCDTKKIRKCLITGLFNNIAELHQRDNLYVVLSNRQRAKIHPTSVLSGYHANLNGFSSTNGNGTLGSKMKDGHNQRPVHVIFSEMVQTTQVYLRTVTRIEPEWIEEVAPECGFTNRINSNQL